MRFIANIIKAISFGVMRTHLKKIEKKANEDSDLQSELDNVAKSNANFKMTLEIFCKKNPDFVLFKDKKLKRRTERDFRRGKNNVGQQSLQ